MTFIYPLSRYRLDFTVATPLHLPAYAGSTLRGAFGGALRSASCMTRQKTCEGCPLLATCPYAQIFETRPLANVHALQNFSHVPRPYVIEPPQWGERNYAPGEPLSFHIVLAGRALEQLPLIILSFVRGFARGVGRGDGTAQLARVVHAGAEETVVLDSPEGSITSHTAIAPAMPDGIGDRVTLHFTSPLRLQNSGRRATADEYTPRRLLTVLLRRIALIHEFHGAGPLPLDFSDLARRAETIESEKNLHWRDWTRYSSRQGQKMALGGVTGSWRLKGDIAPFLPFLHLGQWLHVGKEATFGMGGYRLEASMTAWLVTRHPGALDWAQAHGITFDRHVEHLDPAALGPKDTVIGSLPVNLTAEVCARGATYWNLSLRLERDDRGRELSADELERCGATLEHYEVRRIA